MVINCFETLFRALFPFLLTSFMILPSKTNKMSKKKIGHEAHFFLLGSYSHLLMCLYTFFLFFEFKALIFAHQFKFLQALVLQKDERKINGLCKERGLANEVSVYMHKLIFHSFAFEFKISNY